MEPFTCGKVSAWAKRAWAQNRAVHPGMFRKIKGGYVMYAWQSQIAMARAMGRGYRAGDKKPIHPFDA